MRAGLLSTEKLIIRDAEAFSIAEGSIRPTDTARGAGIPRCPRTHARTYAQHRDLGGLHAIPLSWRDR